MLITRRTFLKHSAITVVGASLVPAVSFSAKKLRPLLGVQLYSIRTDMQKDPLGTLKQVAAMGYKNVEHANYVDRKFYGYEPREFLKILNDLGMKMPSGHTVLGKQHWDERKKEFNDNWKYTVEDAAVVGQQIVISPSLDHNIRKDEDDLKRFMEVFNKSGELCKKSGMKFGYHNHDFEFREKFGDQTLYDIMLRNTDPDLVAQQLDTGNLYNGGAVAIDVIRKYPGRFESLHVKDAIKSESEADRYESTILGKGVANLRDVLKYARKHGGTKHFIIEQEAYQGKTPLECIEEDYKIMKRWGFK